MSIINDVQSVRRMFSYTVGKKLRSDFYIDYVKDDIVFIVDMCNITQAMSVTNDAENVVEAVYKLHGNKRIMYQDTDGNWDELVHKAGVFLTFKRGFSPQ